MSNRSELKKEQKEEYSQSKKSSIKDSTGNLSKKETLKLRNVLVLGSGFISEPCIEYLMRREDNIITIGANILSDSNKLIKNLKEHYKLFLKKKLQTQSMKEKMTKEEKDKLSTKFSSRIKSIEIDVSKDKDKLYELVSKSELVISLVPSFFHIYVMRACIDLNKNLLTTSYIADDFKPMMKEVEDKKLTFMFELGISPGLDHLIAFKEMREQNKLKNEIVSFESWVGAIPSPECIDNPLYYKFSWDPKGALLTLTYDAKQLINGKVITIPEKHLLTNYLVDKNFHPSLNLEGYYNKNSIKYKELYNMKSAKSVVRGIIRYKGFTFIIQCFKHLNLFSNEKIEDKVNTWRDYLNKILKNPRIQDDLFEVKSKYVEKGFELFVYNAEFSDSLVERIFYYNLSLIAISGFDDRYIRKYGFEKLFNRIYSVLVYLELFKEENKILCKDSVLDALSKLLEKKIILKKEYERDLIFMQNEFQIKKNNGTIYNKKYDLIVFGGHGRLPYTATSLLTGYSAAITAQLMLDKKVSQIGIVIPSDPIIVDTVLDELKKLNIFFHETTEMRAKF